MTSYTSPLTLLQAEKLRSRLVELGYEFAPKDYMLFFAKKGKLNIAVYQKGPKVLVQGKETEEFVRFCLEPEILGEARLGYEEVLDPEKFQPHFGIDESGKGDFFGPLVIAGVYTDGEITRRLIDSGVMDSKKIASAARIKKLAEQIFATPGIASQVIAIGPERYNEMYNSFGNLNTLLAWGHARVIENLARLRPNCPRALSDQFARPDVLNRALKTKNLALKLEQRTKGESDTAVAAASILARAKFVEWMENLSERFGVKLPLGASEAVREAGRELVERHGKDVLQKTAKLHFRTTEEILREIR